MSAAAAKPRRTPCSKKQAPSVKKQRKNSKSRAKTANGGKQKPRYTRSFTPDMTELVKEKSQTMFNKVKCLCTSGRNYSAKPAATSSKDGKDDSNIDPELPVRLLPLTPNRLKPLKKFLKGHQMDAPAKWSQPGVWVRLAYVGNDLAGAIVLTEEKNEQVRRILQFVEKFWWKSQSGAITIFIFPKKPNFKFLHFAKKSKFQIFFSNSDNLLINNFSHRNVCGFTDHLQAAANAPGSGRGLAGLPLPAREAAVLFLKK